MILIKPSWISAPRSARPRDPYCLLCPMKTFCKTFPFEETGCSVSSYRPDALHRSSFHEGHRGGGRIDYSRGALSHCASKTGCASRRFMGVSWRQAGSRRNVGGMSASGIVGRVERSHRYPRSLPDRTHEYPEKMWNCISSAAGSSQARRSRRIVQNFDGSILMRWPRSSFLRPTRPLSRRFSREGCKGA